jgi:hypothetical protein
MAAIKYDDWRVENAHRRYPFADDVTLSNGLDLTIPDTLFLDARLYPIGGGPRQYISSITKANSIITFNISDAAAELASAAYSEVDIPENGEVPVYDTYGRPAGILVSTKVMLSAFSSISEGTYEFLEADTAFAATVVIPQPSLGVRGFLLPSGEVVSGDAWLVGEDGIVLRREDDGSIRVDAVGNPFAEQQLCLTEETEEGQQREPYCPIKTINGIAPDEQGNISLTVGANQSLTNLIRITPQTGSGDDLLTHVGEPNQLATAVLRIQALADRRMRGV